MVAAVLGITSTLALQSTSALGGQPEDLLAPLRGEVDLLTATYTDQHPDVVNARSRLAHGQLVVSAWQCLEAAHKRKVPDRRKTCASNGEVLSAVDMALMDKLIEGRDMADSTERARAWGKFRELSSYSERVTRSWNPAGSENLFPRVPRVDWLLLIDALDSAGDIDAARRERAEFERQSPKDWFDCSGPLRRDDFVVFMSARLEEVAAHLEEVARSPLDPFTPVSLQELIEWLSQMFERCATEALGWSAADIDVWVGLLWGRPTNLEDPAELAEIMETFDRRRH